MDMNMGGGADSSAPLTAAGVNLSNETQAYDFLQQILDDSVLGVVGNQSARCFWYGIVVVVGLVAIWNIVHSVILDSRIRASSAKRARPAKPTNLFTNSLATMTAILREASYLQITPVASSFWIKVPPFGSILIIASYFAFILVLEFINNDVSGAQHYQALGVRAGWLAAAQVPLLVLLSGKFNLIGLLCNISYERLNIYHRWVARGLLLLTTFHFSFQSHGWNIYGLMQLEWATDTCPPTGIAAYSIVLWMNLTTLAPFRNMSYEFFVVQHLITYFGFIIALVYHLIGTTSPWAANYIFVSIGLYLFTQLVRIARYVFNNIRPGRATLEALGGGATRVRLSSWHIKKWAPGAHVRLSIPKFGLVQSHPATIVSTPVSHNGDLVFILRAYRGFTRRILKVAEDTSPPSPTYISLIDGPYGGSHSDLACFDTLFLVAGATGVTFTLSNLLDIAHRATLQKLPLRLVHFMWVIRKRSWLSWAAEELQSAFELLHEAGIETHIEIFITCDDIIADPADIPNVQGCQCASGCKCCIDSGQNNDSSPEISLVTGEKTVTSASKSMIKDPKLPCAVLQKGRPVFEDLFRDAICQAEGETAVAVCGPLGLSVSVRSTVVKISDELAVHKGTGVQGIYLHIENFN